jgi:hypothetical protein
MHWQLVNPEGTARAASVKPAPRLADLAGKKLGLAWNGKPGGDSALEEIAALVRQQVKDVQFITYWETVPDSVSPRELSPDVIRAMAASQPDAVIVSQGD